jgi:hypothetical protein
MRDEQGFGGNPQLKRAGHRIQWTNELVQEYVKCSRDPVYFAETHMQIVHVDRGLVPFEMYDYQREIVQTVADNRNTLAVCARQSGKTTAMTAFVLWYILFHQQKDVAILANKGATAREILGRIQNAYQNLPRWLQQGVVEWNKGTFVLENGSRVIADSTASDAIRGYSFSAVVIDECAHIDNWDEFYSSVYPTISSGVTTKLVLISTPYGLNHFYKFYSLAKEDPPKNDFKVIEVPWQRVPGRGEAWRKSTLEAMNYDQDKFDQEFANEWLGSSGTLIAGWKLKELVGERPAVELGGLSMYRKPVPGHTYVATVDVSRGKGLDYSVLQVIDVSTMPFDQACVFRSNGITPADFSEYIARTCRSYNSATVLVEVNDIGGQVSHSLLYDHDYDGVLCTENSGGGRGKRVSAWAKTGSEFGVRTTLPLKNMGCATLKLLVEQNQLMIHDYETISELSTFSKKGNTYAAEPGRHDDLAMTLVLFAWLSAEGYFRSLTDLNTIARMRDMSEADLDSAMIPFGFINPYVVMKETDEPVTARRGSDDWLMIDREFGDGPAHRPVGHI